MVSHVHGVDRRALVSRVGHPVNFGGKKAPYQFAHAQLYAQTCSRKQPPENSGFQESGGQWAFVI